MGTSKQTPAGDRTKALIPPSDDKDLEERRKWLHSSLTARGATMEFQDFLGHLGLPAVYDPFEADAPQLFQSLAKSAPFLNKSKMEQTRMDRVTELQPSGAFSNAGFFTLDKEKAVNAYFQCLVDVMCEEAATHNASSGQAVGTGKTLPERVYDLADYQTKEVPGGGKHKMDLVFFYPYRPETIPNVHIIVEGKLSRVPDPIDEDTLGQIADYQYSVWKAQRTRAFVPVLLVHGTQLDLVAFTRDHWYRVELGPVSYGKQVVRNQDIEKVRLTMARLYYLITLPSERFGHFCDVNGGQQCLRFVPNADENSVLATVESHAKPAVGSSVSDDLIDLSGYIERFIHPRGRLAHVFKTMYRGATAIIKLSWTPVDRLPEGAIYEILEKAGVQGVPRVYDSGLLKNNFFGHRLEYLVLEDCGSSIKDYLISKHAEELKSNAFDESVKSIVQQTLSCLVQARVKGNILHRDISPGNIRVARDGTVKVIDWGYAKVIDDKDMDMDDKATSDRRDILAANAKRWVYDSPKVFDNEEAHDPLTGTPSYMSIPVLSGAKVRGLADDIESLFYVILYVLASLQTTKDKASCGFDTHSNKTLAMVRAGCVSSKVNFLRFFGISDCSGQLLQLLCDLRRFLFENSDGCIAPDLIVKPDTPRGAVGLLEPYIDRETVGLLLVKGGEMLTPKGSGRQMPSIRPPILLTGGPSSPTQNLGSVGISMDGLNLSRNSLLRRGRATEQIEEVDEDEPFGPESKRLKLQGD
ncbi:hypothetical protein LPJ71_002489 [Coemansia sp. S17]|nr:hypothetical protein LPJ71_002489 [Coemansia sp. S17]